MSEEPLDLQGVGPALMQKLHKSLGGDEGIRKALEAQDIGSLACVDGISVRKAVDMVSQYHNIGQNDMARTDRARKIQDDIIQLMRGYACTAWTKDSLYMLQPTKDREVLEKRFNDFMAAKVEMSSVDTKTLGKLLKKHKFLIDPKPKFDSGTLVLVESDAVYEAWGEKGLDRWVTFSTPEDRPDLAEYDIITYLYEEGSLELSGVDNVVMVHSGAKDCEVVPHQTLAFFETNRPSIENMAAINELLGLKGCSSAILELLDMVKRDCVDPDKLEDVVVAVKEEMDVVLEQRVKGLSISGDEILSLLGDGMPEALREVFSDVIKEARSRIRSETGFDIAPFHEVYPLRIDQEVLENTKRQARATAATEAFEQRVRTARELERLRDQVCVDVNTIFELDMRFAMGTFALAYDLQVPELAGHGVSFTDGINIDYALEEHAQRIFYSVGAEGEDSVVMLTGANSGGKTTLLETLCQMVMMAYMGIPVCAKQARIGDLDSVHFFSQRRNLDAGAFESFLRGFMPLAIDRPGPDGTPERKLILADELEAMTELEAASKIISVFVDLIKDTNSVAVIVTHMAQEVGKYTTVRIDGIEAKGLDEDYGLVVDRTPKIGVMARSTPELIVRRLRETSKGEEAVIYGKILERF